MATPFQHLKPFRLRIVDYARQKVGEIESAVKELNYELEFWKKIIYAMNPCVRCNGEGEIRYLVSQDDQEIKKCEACGGTGFPHEMKMDQP